MFVARLQLIVIIKVFIPIKNGFHHKSNTKIFWEPLLHSNFNTPLRILEEFWELLGFCEYYNEYLKEGRGEFFAGKKIS